MDPFLDACGATGPLTFGIEPPGGSGGEARAFDLPFVLVGRDPRCDLRLNHPEVSDRHAYFQLVDGRLIFADLGSRLGVYQDGRCRRLGDLGRDGSVRIGPYRVRLLAGDLGADGASPPALPPPGDPDRDPPVLVLAHRSVRRSRCPLPMGLSLVGTAPDCAVRLVDPSVASYHCGLVRTPRGVWVVDLLGAGGVRVNGHEVGYARLGEGDVVQVGHSEVRPEVLEATAAPTRRPAPVVAEAPAVVAAPAPLAPGVEPEALPMAQAAELVERVVGPLLSQVGHLQQQMVDEFHQARTMMFEAFSSLHQEQSAFLNHELDQLRQLSQDLHALRADLERQACLLASIPAPGLAGPVVSATHGLPAGPRRSGNPALPTPAVNGNGPAGGRRLNPGPGEATPPAPRRPAAQAADPEAAARDAQAHARLCERISAMKREHQSRWQRLLGMIPGAPSAKAPG